LIRTYEVLSDITSFLVQLPVASRKHFEVLEDIDERMLPEIGVFLLCLFQQFLPISILGGSIVANHHGLILGTFRASTD